MHEYESLTDNSLEMRAPHKDESIIEKIKLSGVSDSSKLKDMSMEIAEDMSSMTRRLAENHPTPYRKDKAQMWLLVKSYIRNSIIRC